MRALGEGILAGYGIAIPVGPIAVLLLDTGIGRGFRIASAAAVGVASADLVFASIAALAGLAVADRLEPWADTVRIASAGVLLAIAAYRSYALTRPARTRSSRPERSVGAIYATFLGLTLLNPATVAYFAALILGFRPGVVSSTADKLVFVAGAFVASASWQLLLAGMGAGLHKRLSQRGRLVTALLGNAVIVALALRLLM